MLRLHVGHLHLLSRPEAIYLANIGDLKFTMEPPCSIVVLHNYGDVAILANPSDLLTEDISTIFGGGLQLPALVSIDRLLAQILVRILINIATPHIVVGKVAPHEVVFFS